MAQRPLSPDEPSEEVHTSVPASWVGALDEQAARRGVKRAVVVRSAIERYLAEEPGPAVQYA